MRFVKFTFQSNLKGFESHVSDYTPYSQPERLIAVSMADVGSILIVSETNIGFMNSRNFMMKYSYSLSDIYRSDIPSPFRSSIMF